MQASEERESNECAMNAPREVVRTLVEYETGSNTHPTNKEWVIRHFSFLERFPQNSQHDLPSRASGPIQISRWLLPAESAKTKTTAAPPQGGQLPCFWQCRVCAYIHQSGVDCVDQHVPIQVIHYNNSHYNATFCRLCVRRLFGRYLWIVNVIVVSLYGEYQTEIRLI